MLSTTDFTIEPHRVFCADENGTMLAEVTFPETAPGTFCIDHTFVDERLRGQGVAGQLVQAAVDEIRRQGGTVTATCPYAVRWLEKHGVPR